MGIVAEKVKSAEQGLAAAHPTCEPVNVARREARLKEKHVSLAARLKAGDRLAAEELVDCYYEQIYLYLRRLGHDRHLSEDLTQDAFVDAWSHIGQLRDDGALRGWLYRIAGNVSRLYWRRHKSELPEGVVGPAGGRGTEAGADKAVYGEQLDRLRQAVEELPRKLREVVILHYMEHLTIAEAALAAGIRAGTCKSRLNRAIGILRKRLG